MARPTARTVLVTGASSGFGEAIARRFLAAGDRVVACARRADRLAALGDELGAHLYPLVVDVRDHVAVDGAIGTLPAEFAEVDILVNNAGLARGLDLVHNADIRAWKEMLDTNCAGLMYCARAVLPGMVARGRGHVFNVGSTAGTYPYPGANVYGATKAFVHQFSANMRSDLHGTGVRVTCVEPGLSGGTEFSLVRFGGDQARADATYTGTKPLESEDIAEAVFWTASLPWHVNINFMEMMPVSQSFAGFQVARQAEHMDTRPDRAQEEAGGDSHSA